MKQYFHHENLTKIISNIEKDKLVCIISIVGVFGAGKSFILNHLMKHLQLNDKVRKNFKQKVFKWSIDNTFGKEAGKNYEK